MKQGMKKINLHLNKRYLLLDRKFVINYFLQLAALLLVFIIPIRVNAMAKDNFPERLQMVETQLIDRGIKDRRVLDAMQKVPRHLFMPINFKQYAYEDAPFPIGYNQTISQPFIVALMSEAANLTPNSRVLEIGTGSGYQAAILSTLCKEVYTIEIVKNLGKEAMKKLAELGYHNVRVRIGSGYEGWPEEAPFDAIIVTAAPPELPMNLVEQLKIGGRLIIPVGISDQELLRITRNKDAIKKEHLLPVKFVPMVK